MGLIVPDYMTQWGVAVPVYMSFGRSDFNLQSLFPVMPTDGPAGSTMWIVQTSVRVYKDKETRLANINDYQTSITMYVKATSEQISNDGVFGIVYAELQKLYPNGIMD